MPGKVNPVIPEVVNMVCFRVIGSDLTISMAAEAGQLQLNVFEPVIAACIFEAQTLFINAARTLREHCVDGITANPDVCAHYVDFSIGTVTALNPVIGYERATELAAEAQKTGRGILELVREKQVLTDAQIADVLDPMAMTGQTPRVMTPSAARHVRSALPLALAARAARPPPPTTARTFDGTWSATGSRQTLSDRDRPPPPIASPLRRGRPVGATAPVPRFHGEVIGFDDGDGADDRAGGVDRQPRRSDLQRMARRSAADGTA